MSAPAPVAPPPTYAQPVVAAAPAAPQQQSPAVPPAPPQAMRAPPPAPPALPQMPTVQALPVPAAPQQLYRPVVQAPPAPPPPAMQAPPPAQAQPPPPAASLDRQFLHMQQSVKGHSSNAFLLIVLILCVLGYVAFRMKLIPTSVLNMVGLGGGANDTSGDGGASGSDASGPVGSSAQLNYTPVTGSVVFKGGQANIGKVSCQNYAIAPKDADQYADDDSCKLKVDPCKLVGTSLDASPVCHTVASLCGASAGAGIVPWIDNDTFCFLKEAGSGGAADSNNFMAGITIPEGISLDVNKNKQCSGASEYSKQCTDSGGCDWNQSVWQSEVGLQFGIAPGYQLKCDGKVRYGPPPSSS